MVELAEETFGYECDGNTHFHNTGRDEEMTSNKAEYYKKRAADERAAAMASDEIKVAMVHEEMARQYETRSTDGETSARPQVAGKR